MEPPTSYIPLSLHPSILRSTLETNRVWLGVAFLSLGAVYLSYVYVLCKREAAVAFNVPLPPEVRGNWTGRKWDEVQEEERAVLEGQVRGVSIAFFYSGGCRVGFPRALEAN